MSAVPTQEEIPEEGKKKLCSKKFSYKNDVTIRLATLLELGRVSVPLSKQIIFPLGKIFAKAKSFSFKLNQNLSIFSNIPIFKFFVKDRRNKKLSRTAF